jgi:hypothetical protein
MGGMLADAYVDACDLLDERPRHRTASHLVAHLAREIDSGLRELLLAMLPEDRQRHLFSLPGEQEDSYDPPRRAVIEEICAFLGVPAESDITRTWNGLAWHGRAHRDALRVPRGIDDSLLRQWGDFVFVIEALGQRFEASYITALPLIDELAAIESPTKEDKERLRQKVPQSIVALQRFFGSAGSGWFPLLRKAHYFDSADPLRPDEEGMVSYVAWPPGPYLVRVAADGRYAASVVEVFEALDTDNPQVGECAADAALVVSTKLSARLAAKIARFVESPVQWALPWTAGKVVVRLAAEAQHEAALLIVRALVPAPDRDGRRRLIPFDEIAPAYADLGLDVVRLLADRLSAADQKPDNGFGLAHSRMWRLAIANGRDRDARDELVSALRDAAVAVAGEVGAPAVVETLDAYEPTLFARVALYLLSRVLDSRLAALKLTAAEVFHDAELDPEYTVLLRQTYPDLSEAEQARIVALIEAGPPPAQPAKDPARWRFRQMARLGDALPDQCRDEFAELVTRFGSPAEVDPEFDIESALVTWSGTLAPIDAAELASKTDDDLINFLATWEEPSGWQTPTIDGLAAQLGEAVAAYPRRFSALAPRFVSLDPRYGRTLLATLAQAVGAGMPASGAAQNAIAAGHEGMSWDGMLSFAEGVVQASQPGPPGTSSGGGYPPPWYTCRRGVVELLQAAMDADAVSFDHADRVLGLLLDLAEAPDLPSDKRIILNRSDPTAEARHAVRPLALAATIRYTRWAASSTEGPTVRGYDRVLDVLDTHLDASKDANPAVRSVYGMSLATLFVRLPDWTRANIERIFGSDDGSGLGAVAWQSFLRSNRPCLPFYDLLGPQYAAAVARLPQQTPESESDSAENQAVDQLLSHTASFYALGAIDITNKIMTTLFDATTPIQYRTRLLEIGGQALANTTDPAPNAVSRLQALWDWRETEVTAGHSTVQELSGVGWWVSATIVPAAWSLAKLTTVLASGGAPEPDYEVMDRLAALAPTHLAETVHCLRKLIDAPTDRWLIDRCHKEITTILSAGVNADDLAVQREATDIINVLVARGRTTFEELLA